MADYITRRIAIPKQTSTDPITNSSGQVIFAEPVILVDQNGEFATLSGGSGGGGGTSDATAANQVQEISRLTTLNTGVGTLNSSVGSSTNNNAATSDTGDANLIALIKRLLSIKLPSVLVNDRLKADVIFATIPAFKIDQTTPGNTNKVNIGTDGTVSINGNVAVTGSFFQATQPVSLTTLPSFTTIPTFKVDQTTPGTTNKVSIGNDGSVGINGSVPVTGTFYQSTQPVSLTTLPSLAPGNNVIGFVSNTTFASTQSGVWNINSITGAITLPTGAATSVKQPALGVAGTPSSDVITIQGITNGTPIKVDGSAVTQPISNAGITSIDFKTPVLGQALSSTSVPVVLPVTQITALTPIAGGSTEITLLKLIYTSIPITSTSGSYSSQSGSEKTWTVPSGVEWQITEFYVDLVTSSTTGSRQLAIQVLDSSNNFYSSLPVGVVQGASLTRHYTWAIGLPDLTTFRDIDKLQTPLPPLILPAGFKIKIIDTAVIDATNDSLIVRGLILQRTI